MTDNEFIYCAFLSYSQPDNCAQRADSEAASHVGWSDWLHEALKSFSVPAEFIGQINGRGELIPERIHPVFQDESESSENADLSAEVRLALEQSRCLVVICSPRSAQSRHVNEAVRYFKQLGRSQQILPLVIAGEPNASDKSGASPADECFVPALRHPVQPDGTLDTTRPASRFIYVDARHGVEKREILANDHPDAEADLATAKTQLIALLLGVGFNGLWAREQKRHFVDLSEARQRATAAFHQAEEARRQIHEAQEKILESQNLPRDVHHQIQEANLKAQEAQRQLQEFQNKARDTQSQLEDARQRVLVAENKLSEAQNQVHEARRQTEETLLQLQATANQPPAVPVENQETQPQTEAARQQFQEFQNQLQQTQAQLQEARSQVETAQQQAHEAQKQLQESENQARETQSQLEETRQQVLAAENKFQEMQQQARETQQQLEAARNQILEAQHKAFENQNLSADVQSRIQETQNQLLAAQDQTQTAQSEAELARNQARELQAGLLAAEHQVRTAQTRVAEIDAQLHATQSELATARNQTQAAERKILEEQNQSELARSQVREAQAIVSEIQNQTRDVQTKIKAARRHNKVLALIAVLALLAAGVAGWPRKAASPDLAKANAQAANQSDATTPLLSQEQIRQALQTMGGQDPLRNLDELAARIPVEEIPATLTNTPALLDDRQRTYFQKQLLTRLSVVNPPSAMTNASAITGKIVDAAGTNDSNFYLQLAVLDGWTKTDLPGAFNWVRQLTDTNSQQRALEQIVPALAAENLTSTFTELNALQPAPGEHIYAQLFRRWATNDPAQAIEQLQSLPGYTAGILSNIVTVWGVQSPTNALTWLESQPEGDARTAMIADLFKDWAGRDLTAATAACQQLPDGIAKTEAWEYVLSRRIVKDPADAANDITHLPPGDYRQKAIAELCQQWTNADINTGTNLSTNTPPVLVWAQSLPLESERTRVTNDFVINLAKNNPPAAGQFAAQNPGLSGDALSVIAGALAKTDFTAATNWVSSLPAGEEKNAALSALVKTRAQNDPQGLATYALSLSAGDEQQAVIKELLSRWAPSNPKAALDWLGTFPETNAQPAAVQSVVKAWSQIEPAAAAQWLTNAPTEMAGEGTVNAFLAGAVEKYPDSAAQWTQSVTNEADRQKYQVQVAQQWLKTDPAAAQKWIKTLNLPEAIKSQL